MAPSTGGVDSISTAGLSFAVRSLGGTDSSAGADSGVTAGLTGATTSGSGALTGFGRANFSAASASMTVTEVRVEASSEPTKSLLASAFSALAKVSQIILSCLFKTASTAGSIMSLLAIKVAPNLFARRVVAPSRSTARARAAKKAGGGSGEAA